MQGLQPRAFWANPKMAELNLMNKLSVLLYIFLIGEVNLRGCLQGDEGTLASESTLAGGQRIARVYKQHFTGRVTLQPRTTLCAVTPNGSGNN